MDVVSRTLLLPSGKLATRFWSHGEFYWQLPTRGSDDWVTLGDADVRALAEFVAAENRETGGSIPAEAAPGREISRMLARVAALEPPVLNKSGGSDRDRHDVMALVDLIRAKAWFALQSWLDAYDQRGSKPAP